MIWLAPLLVAGVNAGIQLYGVHKQSEAAADANAIQNKQWKEEMALKEKELAHRKLMDAKKSVENTLNQYSGLRNSLRNTWAGVKTGGGLS